MPPVTFTQLSRGRRDEAEGRNARVFRRGDAQGSRRCRHGKLPDDSGAFVRERGLNSVDGPTVVRTTDDPKFGQSGIQRRRHRGLGSSRTWKRRQLLNIASENIRGAVFFVALFADLAAFFVAMMSGSPSIYCPLAVMNCSHARNCERIGASEQPLVERMTLPSSSSRP